MEVVPGKIVAMVRKNNEVCAEGQKAEAVAGMCAGMSAGICEAVSGMCAKNMF